MLHADATFGRSYREVAINFHDARVEQLSELPSLGNCLKSVRYISSVNVKQVRNSWENVSRVSTEEDSTVGKSCWWTSCSRKCASFINVRTIINFVFKTNACNFTFNISCFSENCTKGKWCFGKLLSRIVSKCLVQIYLLQTKYYIRSISKLQKLNLRIQLVKLL